MIRRIATIQKSLAIAVAFWLTISIPGCGGQSEIELGQVSGIVKYEGTPLAGVTVMFIPDNGRPAMGTTDAEGKYELTYIRDERGCKVGRNRVEIRHDEESANEAAQEGDEAVQTPGPPTEVQIPAKYNSDSELSVDVQPGENKFDFDLIAQKWRNR